MFITSNADLYTIMIKNQYLALKAPIKIKVRFFYLPIYFLATRKKRKKNIIKKKICLME